MICFKCGRKGHYQIGCQNPPMCFVCKTEGHTSSQCPARQSKPELAMYGFGIKRMGFYMLEGGPEEEVELPPNAASLVVT